ncbi:MAG: hypothetical protein ABIQ39_10175, partial [Ilumatobacteraceae bacterium]
MRALVWITVIVAGTAMIVWGAETFAKHLADASNRLGVTAFALALLLARCRTKGTGHGRVCISSPCRRRRLR